MGSLVSDAYIWIFEGAQVMLIILFDHERLMVFSKRVMCDCSITYHCIVLSQDLFLNLASNNLPV